MKHPDRKFRQSAPVQVQSVQLGQTSKGRGTDDPKVAVVTNIQLFQSLQSIEGSRLNVADVVGVHPEDSEVMHRAKAGGTDHCEFVALEEYPLATDRDFGRNREQALLLTGHGWSRLTVAYTLCWTAIQHWHNIQP